MNDDYASVMQFHPVDNALLMLTKYLINIRALVFLSSLKSTIIVMGSQLERLAIAQFNTPTKRVEFRFIHMQKQILICACCLLVLATGCATSVQETVEPPKVIKWDGLEAVMTKKTDQLQVINFWATWCAPCIKELPYFEKLNAESSDKVDVTLISLDFADEFEKRVLPFVDKRSIKSQVMLLDEIDYNSWIDKVDPSWSGAIPATLIINPSNGKRKFLEKELNEGELETLVQEMLN